MNRGVVTSGVGATQRESTVLLIAHLCKLEPGNAWLHVAKDTLVGTHCSIHHVSSHLVGTETFVFATNGPSSVAPTTKNSPVHSFS